MVTTEFLGPLGGRIVAEVLLGLLLPTRRPTSTVALLAPTLGPGGGDYDITDFLRFAGVDPVSRGQ